MRKLLVAAFVTLAGMAARAQTLSDSARHGDRSGLGRRADRYDRPHRDGARAADPRPDHHHREVGGASGTIGTGRVVRADPDGYTLGIGGPNHYVVNASVYPLS